MNLVRWFLFWPVAIVSGTVAGGIIMILGDLLLGHWWLTGCLVIAASALIQPIVATLLSVIIAPRINQFTSWSVLLPYLPIYLSGMFTIFSLIFLGYEGYQIEGTHFGAVSPWWFSLSANIGWVYGFGIALNISAYFQAEQQHFDYFMDFQFDESSNSPSGGAAEAA